jgi:hypothetical protein
MNKSVELVDKKAYFIKTRNERAYQEFEQGVRLFDSDARVMPDGAIWYTTYRDLPKDLALPPDYILISSSHPRGDIYARHSRTTEFKELRINKVPDVETAIRAMDSVLEGQKKRETTQVTALAERAHKLLDLFSGELNTVTDEEFSHARQITEQLFKEVHLNPATIINDEKRRITAWLLKGSTGKDSLERPNRLITVMALSAAYRHATEKYKGIAPAIGKFTRMREALIFEREFDRTILAEVADRLGPEGLPANNIVIHPDYYSAGRRSGVLLGLLHTTRFQLLQPHAAPYMPAGREAAEIIEQMSTLLENHKLQDILSGHLFPKAHAIIANVLEDEKHQYIYPDNKG